MTPKEYCEYWIPIKTELNPGDWGYRAACDREISEITSIPVGTIKGWGKEFENCPESVERTLNYAHFIGRLEIMFQEILKKPQDNLDKE